MELITYSTNIGNKAALDRIAPYLNSAVGSVNWQLDIAGTNRELTVYSPGVINEEVVLKAVRKAGFNATPLDNYHSVY